ncbi:hypothetical protein NHF50_03230 [Flavobacterium sp. NRK F10]|uniref:hypothetical protein n=1 Tax=Flavobacterium sp. NRK F10 TaxID=2954931 RepID=UPI0020907442|nr:hypothetical protein [Flavobacterium sp. NRK F10]MCO6174048.1 hypothetical protein [Flavobacterium sp. NRK F10]
MVSFLFGSLTYFMLSNRHKAIVKTTLLHQLHLVDSDWEVKDIHQRYTMLSPTLLIDGIYKSMEGPKSSRYIQLSTSDELLWITGFNIKAVDEKNLKEVSKDFICHMNVDLNDVHYYSNFNMEDRIGKQYPRLTSLSGGFEDCIFPSGYGIPVKGNEYLYITTQALNLNQPKIFKKVKHLVSVEHEKYDGTQKPLMSKTVFIRLPFDKEDPFKSPLTPGSNQCIPVETKNHCYTDRNGNMLSGHWIIPKGKATYRSSIDEQLQIKDSLRLHFSAIHVHPFATSISLYDATTRQYIFKSQIQNYNDKAGLLKVEPFSSIDGVWLYGNHQYELVMETNNTSMTLQDMMGSMFLFFYDKEMDEKLKLK